jgi:3-hydroxyacyl-[acyl-carrier-protein] dehydratase
MDPRTLLPHRYPFLLIDTIDDVQRGRSARGTKLITGSEWLIIGTREPLIRRAMPHTLIVEALAQLSAAVMHGLPGSSEGAIGYFMGIHNARLRGIASPGDVLTMHVTLTQFRRSICKTHGEATIDGRSIVRVDITSIVRPATADAHAPIV